ncbi:amidohydrolase family protein [Martelella mediterranea]|uniref:adenine deaminase n=1 Tax=Martelella mediterranea TaxID=293089 RepID=UPI001E5726EB|nr:adenine deaminase C-terminal domain-containing protein [Martelella mediterranea]MCD1632511.1 amidohydrolase family protein [Martelella mediterranea]
MKSTDDPAMRAAAVEAARGERPFDLMISGGTVVDVATGELRQADVGLSGGLIAAVMPPGARRDAVETIDAGGAFVSPGLIDMHMHVESSMVTPATYAKAVLPRGVTTIVWDPHELANVAGVPAVDWAIEAARDMPLEAIILAPSCVPSAPGLERAGADFGPETVAGLLARPEIGGIAEVMNMEGVISGSPRMSGIVNAGLAVKKPVFGHARGLSGERLAAFISAGVSSDHELTSGDDLLEKLRAGLTVELRGSHPYLFDDFVEALNQLPVWPQTLTLCTDDVFPDDLLGQGGLDALIRALVADGLSPVQVLQAATLNAARRLHRDDLGLVAAGRRANIAIFEDLETFSTRHVIVDGKVIASDGCFNAAVSDHPADMLRGSMKVEPLSADDFSVKAEGARVEVATIDQPRFTRWGKAEADVQNGFVCPPDGATLISVVHRHGKAAAKPKTGFLRGWGEWRGAFATTVSHDSHNLTIFGRNPEDMAVAANALIECGGGMVVVADGKVKALLALPLLGLLSDAQLEDVARDFEAVRKAAGTIVDWELPYLTFKALVGATLACNAGPHQTDMGIADVEAGTLLEGPVLRQVF